MPTGSPWSPSKRDLALAWKLRKRGKRNGGTIPEICKALGISKSTYNKNRKTFEKFFRAKEREPTGKPRGRPEGTTKLDISEIDLNLLTKLALTGYTYEEIAETLGVTADTLRKYRREFPEVREALDFAVRKDTAEIMAKLTERAKGYSHAAIHFSNFQGDVSATPYTKHYPPDTEAARLILANRIRFVRDVEPQATNNKGRILDALDKLMQEDVE